MLLILSLPLLQTVYAQAGGDAVLIVESNVRDAQVLVDGIFVGGVNQKLRVSAGDRRIRVFDPRHYAFDQRLKVVPSRTYQLKANLRRKPTQQEILAAKRKQMAIARKKAQMQAQVRARAQAAAIARAQAAERARQQAEAARRARIAQMQAQARQQAAIARQQSAYAYPYTPPANPGYLSGQRGAALSPPPSSAFVPATPSYPSASMNAYPMSPVAPSSSQQQYLGQPYASSKYRQRPPVRSKAKSRIKRKSVKKPSSQKSPSSPSKPKSSPFLTEPKKRDAADYIMSFLPLGLPQLRHDKPALGTLMLLLQAGGIGALIYGKIMLDNEQDYRDKELKAAKEKAEAATGQRRTALTQQFRKYLEESDANLELYDALYIGGMASAIGGYGFSVLEALAVGPKQKTPQDLWSWSVSEDMPALVHADTNHYTTCDSEDLLWCMMMLDDKISISPYKMHSMIDRLSFETKITKQPNIWSDSMRIKLGLMRNSLSNSFAIGGSLLTVF